ncbi:MAG: hypothetical protein J5857_03100 [Treponema sp.]|nr:hypothetical protein [Treponema sp.]
MKRLLCTIALFGITLSSLFAELYPSRRYVEMGYDIGVSVGQNAFGIKDVLVKDLVIDFSELNERFQHSDFMVNLGLNPGFHFNVNVNGIGAGIKTDLDFHGNLSIDRALFRLLAEGNDLNESETIGMSLNFESFISTSVPVRFKIGKLGIKVEPTYFVPLIYLPEPRAEIIYTTNEDGSLKAEAKANFDLYTAIDISPLLSETKGDLDYSKLTDSAKNGGIDLGAVVEYALFDFLDVGGYANIPIYPGKLDYHAYGTATASFEMEEGFLNNLDYWTSTEEDRGEKPYKYTEPDWSGVQFDEEGYRVNRPLKLGVEAAWRPVGDWLVIHPKLGVTARNPFGKDFSIHSFSPEYSLSADMTFLYVLGFNVTTAYENQAFSHNVGLRLNTRVVELDFNIGTSNSDFLRSFSLGGVQAQVGIKMGF